MSERDSTNDDQRPLAEVVHLPTGPTLRTGTSKRRIDQRICFHHKTIVDYHARVVECATCGGDLDPLEVLRDFAREGDRYLYILDEKKKLQGECESLDADIKRLKGQRRRLREDLHRVGIGVRMVIASEIERSLGWVAGKRGDQITAVLAKLVATVRNYDVTDVVDTVDRSSAEKAKG